MIKLAVIKERGVIITKNSPNGHPHALNSVEARVVAHRRRGVGLLDDAIKLEEASQVLRDLGFFPGGTQRLPTITAEPLFTAAERLTTFMVGLGENWELWMTKRLYERRLVAAEGEPLIYKPCAMFHCGVSHEYLGFCPVCTERPN